MKQQKKILKNNDQILQRNLEEMVSESFGKYAKYIIQDRALPDVRDGLKPVQRRILYAAHIGGYASDKPHKKSAKLTGEVMGKFHPHGDSSIYDAIVRMSQPWKTNLPLLNMHGNKGSIDGDSAAAMRYTEVRLGNASNWLLRNLDKNTVSFINNFDDTEKEPTVLPAYFFNLLINGASGIAAGYATNIPPFNPKEVSNVLIKLLENPNLSIKEIINFLPAPDFPTKGIIENQGGIEEAYRTGKGKIYIRANYQIVEKKDEDQIVFTDIPFETNKANIIRQIDYLMSKGTINNVLEIRDESNRDGINIVLDIEKNAPIETLTKYLYKNTDLRISYNMNFVVINKRKPELMPINNLLNTFLVHLKEINLAAFKFDQNKLQQRHEVIKGLIKAISIIDEVINVIRHSSDKLNAKNNLMLKFMFTELQAEAIVQLRLYRLSNTDIQALTNEKDDIEQQLAKLLVLINDPIKHQLYLKNELQTFAKTFNLERQTKIENTTLNIEVLEDDLIINKSVLISYTKQQQIKIMDDKKIEQDDLINNKIKIGDLYDWFLKANNKDQLLIITNLGNYVLLPIHKIPTKRINALGTNLVDFINLNLNENIISVHLISFLANQNRKSIVLITKDGMTKRIKLVDLLVTKALKLFKIISLKENDLVMDACLTNNENGSLYYFSKNGYVNHVLISSINVLSRQAAGQKAMRLKNNDQLVKIINATNQKNVYLMVNFTNGLKKIQLNDIHLSKLTSSGNLLTKMVENFNNAFLVTNQDFIWTLKKDHTLELNSVKNIKEEKLGTKLNLNTDVLDISKETMLATLITYSDQEVEHKIEKLV